MEERSLTGNQYANELEADFFNDDLDFNPTLEKHIFIQFDTEGQDARNRVFTNKKSINAC